MFRLTVNPIGYTEVVVPLPGLDEAHRVIGKIHAHQKQWTEAETSLLTAIRAHEEIQLMEAISVCQYELSIVYRAWGQAEKAKAMLEVAAAGFERYRMKLFGEKARALQAQS